jgi:S1-C subfamily serine protease
VTPRGIIQKEYLKHFVTTKKSEYGDIGIRVKNEKGRVVVTASDPFFEDNPFKVNDVIVALDGKKVQAASTFMRRVLFSQVGSKHSVKVQRQKRYLTHSVVTKKRYGGGEVSDTFLESRGLYFDRRLSLVKIEKKFKNYGIKEGDRLIQIDGVLVKNQKELREYLQSAKDYTSLLFERDGFEFFVNIK